MVVSPRPRGAAARITVFYVVIAGLSVLLADQIAEQLARSLQTVTWLDTYVAWAMIALTAPLIYVERRRAELEASRLRTIVEASSEAIFGLDRDGHVTSWNPGAAAIFGPPAREAVGRPLWELWPAAGDRNPHAELEPVLAAVQLGQRQQLADVAYTRADGRPGSVSLTFSPVRTPEDEITGIAVTGRDITRRKADEEALRRSESQVRLLTDTLPVLIAAVDREHRLHFCNTTAAGWFGCDAAAALGRRLAEIAPAGMAAALAAALARAFGGEVVTVEVEVDHPQLGPRHLCTTAIPQLALDDPAEIVGAYLLTEDVTERLRAARAMRLAEVGELASGLVHEVRNPLNAMRLQTARLRRRLADGHDLPPRTLEPLDRLEAEIQRVQELTSEFLAYGRPASEQPVRLPVGAQLAEIAAFVVPSFEADGCRIRLRPPAGGPDDLAVSMDASKFKQILLNLTENARQALTPGGEVTLAWESASPGRVRIEVADTGAGIPPEQIDRVFAPFFSTREDGTGLGLAIVKQTVEAAGGRVTLTSASGRGTRVHVELPAAPEVWP